MVYDSLKQTHIYELLLFFGLTLVQLYELLLFFWFNIGAVNLLWFNFPVFKSNPVSLSLRCF